MRIGFDGRRRRLDLGVINGEHFAVMAGAGFDAMMIRDADRGMKAKLGQAAYVWTGLRSIKASQAEARVRIDGADWFEGRTSCVLVGNVGTVTGGLQAFEAAEPDDGWLDVGVVTAKGAVQWARTFGRAVVGNAARSPFVRTTRAKSVDVRFDHPVAYELDGGDRDAVKHLEITVEPGAIEICVPETPAPTV